MQREPWLHSSRFLRAVQNTIEDLPFDVSHLFNQKINESLHSLKDSRATLQLLGIYTPAPKQKFYLHLCSNSGLPSSSTRGHTNLLVSTRRPNDPTLQAYPPLQCSSSHMQSLRNNSSECHYKTINCCAHCNQPMPFGGHLALILTAWNAITMVSGAGCHPLCLYNRVLHATSSTSPALICFQGPLL